VNNLPISKSSQTSSLTSLIVVSSGVSFSSCPHQGKAQKPAKDFLFLLLFISKILLSCMIIQLQTFFINFLVN
jgi:hypothetical protein